MYRRLLSCFFAFCLFLPTAVAQRPVPYPVFTTPQFDQAVANGTRNLDGTPGTNYWTNTASYSIEAALMPDSAFVVGDVIATYTNNSPDTLDTIVMHLRQNLHKAGAVRNRPQQLTGGMDVQNVTVDYSPADYDINGTLMYLALEKPLLPDSSLLVGMHWTFKIPEPGAPRMGGDGEVFFVAYWYPQFAMYDDLRGWKADQYMGNGEFYMGFADYDVHLTAPAGWVMAATGTLQNPMATLSDSSQARLARASRTRDIVSMLSADEVASGFSATQPGGVVTWHYKAEQVRDFAFGTSNAYAWDATSALAGDVDGDGAMDTTMIHAFYRPGKAAWPRGAEFTQYSVEFMADKFFPYPYPHMTAMEGVVGGGMEFPMMTHIGGNRTDQSLFSVTLHEVAHMWFPMIVGQDEKAYTWMDEGLTSFNTNEGKAAFWNDSTQWLPSKQSYYRIAGTGDEAPSMRHGDQYPYGTAARGIASYRKPAVALHALRGLIGEEAFMHAYRTYAARWMWKHATPYDFFNTFEDVLGQDLDWFWTPMFFETWTLDHAIKDVAADENGVTVMLEDRGLTPMPLPVRLTYKDGNVEEGVVSLDTWLSGNREAQLTFPAGEIQKVEIDPGLFLPDVDRSNNTWQP
ncbi:MAG: M1 family metallopeptidase [Bacteroidota bacterium]